MKDDDYAEAAARAAGYRVMSDLALDLELGKRGITQGTTREDGLLQPLWRESAIRKLEQHDQMNDILFPKKKNY